MNCFKDCKKLFEAPTRFYCRMFNDTTILELDGDTPLRCAACVEFGEMAIAAYKNRPCPCFKCLGVEDPYAIESEAGDGKG